MRNLREIEGISCTIIVDPKDITRNFDIVHIFNIQNPRLSLAFARSARYLGIKVVLSTIYWDLRDSMFINYIMPLIIRLDRDYISDSFQVLSLVFNKLLELPQKILNKPYYLSGGYLREAKELISMADLLLPNSDEEYEIVRRHFNLSKPYSVIVNAIDAPDFDHRNSEERSGIITVGRIEPTKNQLNTLRALKRLGLKITLIGRFGDKAYSALIRKKYPDEISNTLGRQVPLDVVYDELARHRVHVLASFRESPGLSSLEALAMGCNIVVSSKKFCPVNTYFENLIGKHVFICNPYSYTSIQRAIYAAYTSALPDVSTVNDFRKTFSWKNAARQTAAAYRQVLDENI